MIAAPSIIAILIGWITEAGPSESPPLTVAASLPANSVSKVHKHPKSEPDGSSSQLSVRRNEEESFSDAEGGEDQIEYVVGGGLAGQRVECPEAAIEIEQDHLMGNSARVGASCVVQGRERGGDGLVVAETGEHAGFGGGAAGSQRQDAFPQRGNAFAGQ